MVATKHTSKLCFVALPSTICCSVSVFSDDTVATTSTVVAVKHTSGVPTSARLGIPVVLDDVGDSISNHHILKGQVCLSVCVCVCVCVLDIVRYGQK